MSDKQDSKQDEHLLHVGHDGIIHQISGSEKRENDRDEREKERARVDDSYKSRQILIEERQLAANNRIALYTSILAILTLLGTIASFISSSAAKTAAETSVKTLMEMEQSGRATASQIDRLISEQQRAASAFESVDKDSRAALKETVKQNRDSLVSTLAQSQKALDTSVLALRLENRPWVNFSEPSNVRIRINVPVSFRITAINSGKTPAFKLRTLVMSRLDATTDSFLNVDDPVPDSLVSVSIMPPGGVASTNTIPLVISPSDMEFFSIKAVQIRIYAIAKYEDVFGSKHITKFCYLIGSPTGGPGTSAQCPTSNEMN